MSSESPATFELPTSGKSCCIGVQTNISSGLSEPLNISPGFYAFFNVTEQVLSMTKEIANGLVEVYRNEEKENFLRLRKGFDAFLRGVMEKSFAHKDSSIRQINGGSHKTETRRYRASVYSQSPSVRRSVRRREKCSQRDLSTS